VKTNILSQYNRTIFYTYFVVLALAVAASLIVLNKNRSDSISERYAQVKTHEHQVELLLDSGVRAVNSLNQYAMKHLSLAEAPRIELLLSYYYYTYNSIDEVFEIIPNVKEELQDQFESSLISGSGNLEKRSNNYYREMDMLFEMNLSFPVAMEMVPDAAWVYYLSNSNFIGIYPWPGDDYGFSESIYQGPAYIGAIEKNNPTRDVYWTDAYMDKAGKGLMTTVGMPLYINDKFHGAIAMDITLSSLSKELMPQADFSGYMFLLDQQQQVMAHNTDNNIINEAATKPLSEYLPAELISIPSQDLFAMTQGGLVNGYYVQSIELVNAPFRLIYFQLESDLFADSWRQFMISLVSLMLALSILVSVVHWLANKSFIGPASKLMLYLEDCAKEPQVPPQEINAGWMPFFTLINRTFAENKSYTLQLAEDNRQLDMQVAQRTEKLRETTKRREHEYALLRGLIDSIPDVIFYKDTDGKFLGCNTAAHHLFGLKEEEIIGRGSRDFLEPELATYLSQHDSKVTDDNETVIIQQRIVVEGEEQLWETKKTPYTGIDGELLGLIGLARDITKEYAAAEKLRYSEERYALAMDAVEEGLWDWHLDDDQLHCNPAYFTMLGYEHKNDLSTWQGFRSLVHKKDWPAVYQKINFHLENTSLPYEHEFRMLTQDGDFEWILARGSVVEYDEKNRPTRMLGTHKNITARKEFERDIMEAKRDAEMANRYKSEFLANMSHEIRTPMNGVMGMIQLALHTSLDDHQYDYLNKAQNSAQALLHIINDILDFSKIEAGKLELENAPFVLEEMLDAVINVNVIAAQKKGIDLLLDAPTQPMSLIGDSLRLSQVMTNIVSNAVKFTEQGHVEIGCYITQKTTDKVTIEFKVTDTGIGIEHSKLPKLFKAFSQADGSTTREFGGSGLGLSISDHLVRMMGGEFEVVTQLNHGSVFSFSISLDCQVEAEPRLWKIPDWMTASSLMLIASHHRAVSVYDKMLSQIGFKINHANNIELAMHEHAAPQFILLDWSEGYELMQLRSLTDRYPKTLVFLLVNYGDDVLNNDEIKTLVAGIFSKPLSPQDVIQRMGQYLQDSPKPQIEAVEKVSHIGRLLLVDDNIINQQVAKGLLESKGYEVDVAENGQIAVEAVQSRDYQTVLMDIQMPVMDGLAAAQEIRKTFSKELLPIIAMTAHAMAGDKEKSLAAGMNDHITKPLVLKEMFETIARCISESDK